MDIVLALIRNSGNYALPYPSLWKSCMEQEEPIHKHSHTHRGLLTAVFMFLIHNTATTVQPLNSRSLESGCEKETDRSVTEPTLFLSSPPSFLFHLYCTNKINEANLRRDCRELIIMALETAAIRTNNRLCESFRIPNSPGATRLTPNIRNPFIYFTQKQTLV